ncbi:substrate binding domain-containing protein, partial [Asaia sp. SF2.1]
PAYLARAGMPLVPADLVDHSAIVYSQLPNVWSFHRDGSAVSVSVTGHLRVSAAEGLRAAILADMGLTITSDWMFAPELESGAVTRLLPAWSLPDIDLWAVFPTGRMMTAKARQFADFVQGLME